MEKVMRDISLVLDRWASWALSDNLGIDYSSIAAGFKGLITQASKSGLPCSDDDGLVIERCLAKLKNKKPEEYTVLVAHYLYGVSKRKIAKKARKDERLIRSEIQIAEGFIEGCLSMLDVKLEMD